MCVFVFYEDIMNRASPAPAASNGITPLQQMAASCSGAILTSLIGEMPRLNICHTLSFSFKELVRCFGLV